MPVTTPEKPRPGSEPVTPISTEIEKQIPTTKDMNNMIHMYRNLLPIRISSAGANAK